MAACLIRFQGFEIASDSNSIWFAARSATVIHRVLHPRHAKLPTFYEVVVEVQIPQQRAAFQAFDPGREHRDSWASYWSFKAQQWLQVIYLQNSSKTAFNLCKRLADWAEFGTFLCSSPECSVLKLYFLRAWKPYEKSGGPKICTALNCTVVVWEKTLWHSWTPEQAVTLSSFNLHVWTDCGAWRKRLRRFRQRERPHIRSKALHSA